jgi:type I site-specific restriction-modification system R (restriction) subunit
MVQNNQIADALYIGDASDETFKQVFTKTELIDLWENYCVYKHDDNGKLIDPASYDDEVYNALDRYGYWDNK